MSSARPRVSGFTLVRNGVRFDYPFEESIRSLLPLVDELVINVGIGDDETETRIAALKKSAPGGEKIKTFQSRWPLDDPEKKKGGLILSEQTNLALDQCTGDWCIYLQADEVLHEADYPQFHAALARAHADPQVEGLLFDYIHFYGSFDVIQQTRSAYRREVRAIRRSSGGRSVGDAQSFRKPDGSKLKVIRSGARVFHYGWVRTPDAMREKTFFMDQLYHGSGSGKNADAGKMGVATGAGVAASGAAPGAVNTTDAVTATGDNYRYKRFWGLRRFTATHPGVMRERIQNKGWHWDLSRSPFVWNWKDLKKVVLDSVEQVTGYRFFEYRSYRLIRGPK